MSVLFEVLPSVACDVELGRLAANIEVDDYYFAKLMAQHGMDEAAIDETKIVLTAETNEDNGESRSSDDPIQGITSYDPKTQTITVNIGSLMSGLDCFNRTIRNGTLAEEELNRLGSSYVSRRVLNDVGLRIEDLLDDARFEEEFERYQELAPEKLLGRAVRRIQRMTRSPKLHELADISRKLEVLDAMLKPEPQHYEGSPSEIRADEITAQAVKNWYPGYCPIRVTFRENSFNYVYSADAESVH